MPEILEKWETKQKGIAVSKTWPLKAFSVVFTDAAILTSEGVPEEFHIKGILQKGLKRRKRLEAGHGLQLRLLLLVLGGTVSRTQTTFILSSAGRMWTLRFSCSEPVSYPRQLTDLGTAKDQEPQSELLHF